MKNITILGATGSIGKNTLSLLSQHPDKFRVFALTAHSKIDILLQQCLAFNPTFAVVSDEKAARILREKIKATKLNTVVLSGAKSLEEVAAHPDVDYVMAGIVGAVGLLPTLAAARAGKRILLANKEALVMSGALFMEVIQKSSAVLLPVDSEHNAIFQCLPSDYLPGSRPPGVEKIILTASGGPFRTLNPEQFKNITPEQAIAHPNWQMGPKISVDSATLMNKGFEVIEAFWLFQMPLENIEVIVHPESIIHSLVCYDDGSMLAQLGPPDMRVPIAYTLSWPARIKSSIQKLDLIKLGQLHFEAVDQYKYPCLALAYAALRAGGSACAVLNAANEFAVSAFLQKQIRFTDIPAVIQEVMSATNFVQADSYEIILAADQEARRLADAIVRKRFTLSHAGFA